MKRMIQAVALMLTLLSMISASTYAQVAATPDAGGSAGPVEESAWARGFDAPASLFSERGDVIASISVTGVERGWQEYAEFYEPAAGKEYVAVTFEVSMEGRGNIVVGAYALTLLDGYGYMNYAAFAEADPTSDQEILLEDVEVASGETLEFTAIFEVFEGAPLGFLMWQPEYAFYAMVDFTDEDV